MSMHIYVASLRFTIFSQEHRTYCINKNVSKRMKYFSSTQWGLTAVKLDHDTIDVYWIPLRFIFTPTTTSTAVIRKTKNKNIKNSQNVFEFSSLRSRSMSARPLTNLRRRFINIVMTKARWSMKNFERKQFQFQICVNQWQSV